MNIVHHSYGTNYSAGERRLCFFAEAKKREELIEEFETTGKVPFRERTDVADKLNKNKDAAVNKVKDIETSKWEKMKAWWNKTIAIPSKKALEATITKIAEENLKKTGTELKNSGNRALSKIESNTRGNKRSLSILSEKANVSKEVIGDLTKEIDALKVLRDEYEQMAELLGQDTEKIDVPGLKALELKREVVEEINAEAEEKISENDLLNETKQIDEKLSHWLLTQDPSIAQNLEQLLLDNATGNGRQLEQAFRKMEKDGKIHPSERDLFLSMAKRLRGADKWWFQKKKYQGVVADYYRKKISEKGELNDSSINERLKKLRTLPIGQKIQIQKSGALAAFAISRKQGDQIIVSGPAGIGVIDTSEDMSSMAYMFTLKNRAGKYDHSAINAPDTKDSTGTRKPEYRDPTIVYLGIA